MTLSPFLMYFLIFDIHKYSIEVSCRMTCYSTQGERTGQKMLGCLYASQYAMCISIQAKTRAGFISQLLIVVSGMPWHWETE